MNMDIYIPVPFLCVTIGFFIWAGWALLCMRVARDDAVAMNEYFMRQRDQATHERDHYATILAELGVKVEPGSGMNEH